LERHLLYYHVGASNRVGPGDAQMVRELRSKGETKMLWTIFLVLLVLWLLGMVTSYTLGGFIHLLLILAIVVVLIRVIQGRSPV
jgi:hypothetical protein